MRGRLKEKVMVKKSERERERERDYWHIASI